MTSFLEAALAAEPAARSRVPLGIKLSADMVAHLVDSALAEQSPGLIQAAVDFVAVSHATKDDVNQAKTDVLKQLTGGKTFTDKPWTVCPKTTNAAAINSTGTVEARSVNGIVTLRGDVTVNTAQPLTDGWVTVRQLPADFPKPDLTVAVSINGYVSGTTYTPAGVRIYSDGSLQIISTTQPTKGFSFNGILYQGF